MASTSVQSDIRSCHSCMMANRRDSLASCGKLGTSTMSSTDHGDPSLIVGRGGVRVDGTTVEQPENVVQRCACSSRILSCTHAGYYRMSTLSKSQCLRTSAYTSTITMVTARSREERVPHHHPAPIQHDTILCLKNMRGPPRACGN